MWRSCFILSPLKAQQSYMLNMTFVFCFYCLQSAPPPPPIPKGKNVEEKNHYVDTNNVTEQNNYCCYLMEGSHWILLSLSVNIWHGTNRLHACFKASVFEACLFFFTRLHCSRNLVLCTHQWSLSVHLSVNCFSFEVKLWVFFIFSNTWEMMVIR